MQVIVQILFYLFTTLLVAGLIQPWWVLWWMNHQNRMKVLKYYGFPLLILSIGMMLV